MWHGSFWHEGRQVFRSTGEREKGKALQVVLAWEEAVRRRPESAGQARRVMEELLAPILSREGPVRCTVGEYCRRWLLRRSEEVSPATRRAYEYHAEQWSEAMGRVCLSEVTAERLAAWRAVQLARHSRQTAKQRLNIVRQILECARRDGYVRENAARGLTVRMESHDPGYLGERRRPFSSGEIAAVEGVLRGDGRWREWRGLFLFGLWTGQRLGDCARASWEQLDLAGGTWTLRQQKRGRAVVMPLAGPLGGWLAEWASQWARSGAAAGALSGPVFPELRGKITAAGEKGVLSTEFARILRLAGLRGVPGPAVSGRRRMEALSFHSLRHTFRTRLEESGVPKAVIDAMVGHSGDTGRIYTAVGMDALRAGMGRLEAGGLEVGGLED